MVKKWNKKEWLFESGFVLGTFLQFYDTAGVEILSEAGFDYVIIDLEHGIADKPVIFKHSWWYRRLSSVATVTSFGLLECLQSYGIHPVHRRIFHMLQGYLLGRYRHISFHHLKACVSEDLLEEEDVATIGKISAGEGMPTQMGMETLNPRLTGEASKDQLQRI